MGMVARAGAVSTGRSATGRGGYRVLERGRPVSKHGEGRGLTRWENRGSQTFCAPSVWLKLQAPVL